MQITKILFLFLTVLCLATPAIARTPDILKKSPSLKALVTHLNESLADDCVSHEIKVEDKFRATANSNCSGDADASTAAEYVMDFMQVSIQHLGLADADLEEVGAERWLNDVRRYFGDSDEYKTCVSDGQVSIISKSNSKKRVKMTLINLDEQ